MKSDPEAKPALRISHIVYKRIAEGNRVRYLIDPKGIDQTTAIPEQVVLKRWRRRIFAGHVFKGARLSATVWRAWHATFGMANVREMSPERIKRCIETAIPSLKQRHLKLPDAETVWALAQHCDPMAICLLIERHTTKPKGESGVPDLFLYAVRSDTDQVSIARFVEVKKPQEKLSESQRAEIAFLQTQGLHARVLRLNEREIHEGQNPM